MTLNQILKDGKASQMQGREGGEGEGLQAEEAAGERARGLPQSYETISELPRDTWHRSISSMARGDGGISFRKPNLSTPWAQRRKTEARVSLALNVHSPLQPRGCSDTDAACVNSAGWDCSELGY